MRFVYKFKWSESNALSYKKCKVWSLMHGWVPCGGELKLATKKSCRHYNIISNCQRVRLLAGWFAATLPPHSGINWCQCAKYIESPLWFLFAMQTLRRNRELLKVRVALHRRASLWVWDLQTTHSAKCVVHKIRGTRLGSWKIIVHDEKVVQLWTFDSGFKHRLEFFWIGKGEMLIVGFKLFSTTCEKIWNRQNGFSPSLGMNS